MTFTDKVLLFVLVAVGVAVACFLIGFLYGYFNWIPELRDSRFIQACHTGAFFMVASVILDPILYFSFYSYFARKWRGNDSV